MNPYHIAHNGEVQYCGQQGACGSPFGHFPSPQQAIEKRIQLAGQGRLYLAGVQHNGNGGEE